MDTNIAKYENGNLIACIDTNDLLDFIENYIGYSSSKYVLHIEGLRFGINNTQFILSEQEQ